MSAVIGLSACALSSLLFGSMFVPVKNSNPRDGIFAQWMMSISILIIGFFVFAFSGFPGFYPLAMLGGAIWCIGNAAAFMIISRLGLALFVLICNITTCSTGWAGGRFGLFGMKAKIPASVTLNYIGLFLVIFGGIAFSRISGENDEKTGGKRKAPKNGKNLEDSDKTFIPIPDSEFHLSLENVNNSETTNKKNQRIYAIIAALVSGVLYGCMFVPVIYMIDNPDLYPNQPTDGLSYVFSHYFGIFLTSTIIFVIYAIFKKNKPYVAPELCLPAMCSGLLFAIAQTSFFIANQNLSQAITFPIISQLPGCVASAWSIFYYKEIQGRRNFIILGLAMTITLSGALLVALSESVQF